MGEPWPWVEVGPGLYRGETCENTHDFATLSHQGKSGNEGPSPPHSNCTTTFAPISKGWPNDRGLGRRSDVIMGSTHLTPSPALRQIIRPPVRLPVYDCAALPS
jgi:hypothetical protein